MLHVTGLGRTLAAGWAHPVDGGVVAVADSVRRRQRRATDVVELALARVSGRNEGLNAFVHVDASLALALAEQIDARVAAGEDPGPLSGVPFGVKDLDDCAGMPTAMGTALLRENPPAHVDAPHVARLRAAGAVPIGKTATAELGIDSATSTPAFGVTRNPWNLACTPGGSSGGSAAAVAGGLVPFATGSDGGGSIRDPASLCGLVGLKPSHGRVPLARPNDTGCQGALTTSTRDAARILDVIAGPTGRDRMSLPRPAGSYEDGIDTLPVDGLRVAWSADLGYAHVEPEVATTCREAAEALIAACRLRRVNADAALPDPRTAWLPLACHDLYTAVAATGLWPSGADTLGPITRLAIEYGSAQTVEQLDAARAARREFEDHVAELFEQVDILLTPMMAVDGFPAEGHGRHQLLDPAPDPFGMPANLTWQPAISVPAGLSRRGLPVGLQIVTRRHREDVALRIAHIYELTTLSDQPVRAARGFE